MKSQAEEDLISPISGFIHLPEIEIYINLNAQKKLPKNLVTCNWLICFATKCANHHFSAHKSMWRIKIRYLPKTCTGAWGQITQMRWVVFTHIHPSSEAHIDVYSQRFEDLIINIVKEAKFVLKFGFLKEWSPKFPKFCGVN